MDAVRIVITRGCNADGTGGTVFDDASGVLGSLPDGAPILDALAAAFAEAYGVVETPTGKILTNDDGVAVPEMRPNPWRNISYRMRVFATEILSAYAQDQAKRVAAEHATAAVDATLAAVSIVDNTASQT